MTQKWRQDSPRGDRGARSDLAKRARKFAVCEVIRLVRHSSSASERSRFVSVDESTTGRPTTHIFQTQMKGLWKR